MGKKEQGVTVPVFRFAQKKFIVLRDLESETVFWTSGCQYRSDRYELIFQSDSLDEVKDFYMKQRYDRLIR